MRKSLLIVAALVLAALSSAPAGALQTVATSDRWGCIALDALGGLCLGNPFGG